MEGLGMRRVQWDTVILWTLMIAITVGVFLAAQTELRL